MNDRTENSVVTALAELSRMESERVAEFAQETVPGFYPVEGRWGQDIVSLLNTPGVNENTCYLSGGSDQEGGGRTRDLWVYYPDGQAWASMPSNGPKRPVPRTDHAAIFADGGLHVFGGRGCCGSGVYGDLWVYSFGI